MCETMFRINSNSVSTRCPYLQQEQLRMLPKTLQEQLRRGRDDHRGAVTIAFGFCCFFSFRSFHNHTQPVKPLTRGPTTRRCHQSKRCNQIGNQCNTPVYRVTSKGFCGGNTAQNNWARGRCESP